MASRCRMPLAPPASGGWRPCLVPCRSRSRSARRSGSPPDDPIRSATRSRTRSGIPGSSPAVQGRTRHRDRGTLPIAKLLGSTRPTVSSPSASLGRPTPEAASRARRAALSATPMEGSLGKPAAGAASRARRAALSATPMAGSSRRAVSSPSHRSRQRGWRRRGQPHRAGPPQPMSLSSCSRDSSMGSDLDVRARRAGQGTTGSARDDGRGNDTAVRLRPHRRAAPAADRSVARIKAELGLHPVEPSQGSSHHPCLSGSAPATGAARTAGLVGTGDQALRDLLCPVAAQ